MPRAFSRSPHAGIKLDCYVAMNKQSVAKHFIREKSTVTYVVVLVVAAVRYKGGV